MNHLYNDVIVPNPDNCITTDASCNGLGAVMESNSTRVLFSTSEMKEHINVLELKAILSGLKGLAKSLTKIHIEVFTDNSTAVACINKFSTCRSYGFRDKRDVAMGLWFFSLVVCNTLTRDTKYGSRLWISEIWNTHWMEIEWVCISLHIWRIRILSNYRPACNKNQYTTENFCLL